MTDTHCTGPTRSPERGGAAWPYGSITLGLGSRIPSCRGKSPFPFALTNFLCRRLHKLICIKYIADDLKGRFFIIIIINVLKARSRGLYLILLHFTQRLTVPGPRTRRGPHTDCAPPGRGGPGRTGGEGGRAPGRCADTREPLVDATSGAHYGIPRGTGVFGPQPSTSDAHRPHLLHRPPGPLPIEVCGGAGVTDGGDDRGGDDGGPRVGRVPHFSRILENDFVLLGKRGRPSTLGYRCRLPLPGP